ncbi:integrase [Thioclava sp. GXIMD4216]|uniref:integrase n=1 Tax=Thioclava sp. GXIMD4216 TaxID=3131929 RepID=UPI0030D16232
MAAKLRYWKEKNGRYWARITLREDIRHLFGGKTELTEPLGGDLRVAKHEHDEAVARLKRQIKLAQEALKQVAPPAKPASLRALSEDDIKRAIWEHFQSVLTEDTAKRAEMPSPADIERELERFYERVAQGYSDVEKYGLSVLSEDADYRMAAGARYFYEQLRTRKLSALRRDLQAAETKIITPALNAFIASNGLDLATGSAEWRDLAMKMIRAEIDALDRTMERDQGIYNDTPRDTIIQPVTPRSTPTAPVKLMELFEQYIATKQHVGTHVDGGRAWRPCFIHLIDFLGHDDARKVAKADLLKWRDSLLKEGKSTKTVSAKYLAAIRAVFKWAKVNDILEHNPSEDVKQETKKKIKTREQGFTTLEAEAILQTCVNYVPEYRDNPANRESAHITAAKRWAPLLCAFTGARITEITQLRKEDIRQEGDGWVMRITPEAGSVKDKRYRDIPLHQQLIELGFLNFLASSDEGPLFHNATDPEKYLKSARATGGRVAKWLKSLGLIPENMQPNHAWRHRFKTLSRDLSLNRDVVDAINGHATSGASGGYGDSTLLAKKGVITKLENYDLAARNSSSPSKNVS